MRRAVSFAILAGAVGCRATAPDISALPSPMAKTDNAVRQVSHTESDSVPASLTLDNLLAIARERNPSYIAAVARIGEARGRMLQAGLYPNPSVGYSGSQINDEPGSAGQQGAYVSQEFVTAGKLRIAREAANSGVTVADWNAASKWYDTAAMVKAAYYEFVTAQAVLRESERMAALFEGGLTQTEKLANGGRVEAYDVTRLRVELNQARNRVGAAKQRVTAAARMLAVAVGVDRLPVDAAVGDLPDPAAVPGFDEAAGHAAGSSFVMAPIAEVEQAKAEVRQAEVKPIPNLNVMAGAAYDFSTNSPIANVQAGIPLPVWDKNQGNIQSARFRLQTAMAGVEQARLRAIERLTAAYQKHDNARRQLDLYRTSVLPGAETALEQIEKVYSAKGERFFDTLDARRVLAQARIDAVQTLGDLWSATAEIEAAAQFPMNR